MSNHLIILAASNLGQSVKNSEILENLWDILIIAGGGLRHINIRDGVWLLGNLLSSQGLLPQHQALPQNCLHHRVSGTPSARVHHHQLLYPFTVIWPGPVSVSISFIEIQLGLLFLIVAREKKQFIFLLCQSVLMGWVVWEGGGRRLAHTFLTIIYHGNLQRQYKQHQAAGGNSYNLFHHDHDRLDPSTSELYFDFAPDFWVHFTL